MKKVKKILVAFDFSEGARQAVREALFLASKWQSKVSLVHVLDADISAVFATPLSENWKTEVLEAVQKDLEERQDASLSKFIDDIKVEFGLPYKEIVKLALEQESDLIVVGSHGRSKLGYALLGSVADKVARFSPVPVLISRLGRDFSKGTTLVPVELSEGDESLLSEAKDLTNLLGTKLVLAHAVQVDEYYQVSYQNVFKASKEKAEKQMNDLVSSEGVGVATVLLEGSPARELIDYINDHKEVGLVAMMTHGTKGLKALLLGSTTEALSRYASCSVLTIPTAEHREKILSIQDQFKEDNVTLDDLTV